MAKEKIKSEDHQPAAARHDANGAFEPKFDDGRKTRARLLDCLDQPELCGEERRGEERRGEARRGERSGWVIDSS